MPADELNSDLPRPLWVDIEGGSEGDVRFLLTELGVGEEAATLAAQPVDSPRILPFDDVFLASPPADSAEGSGEYMTLLCNDDLLVTIHQRQVPSIKGLGQQLTGDQRMYASHPAMLMLQVLLHCLYANTRQVFAVRSQVDDLRRSVATSPSDLDMARLTTLKAEVERLAVIADDLLFCASALLLIKTNSFNIERQRDLYRDLADQCRNFSNWIDALSDQLRDIHSEYTLVVQRRTEDRVNLLTIVTAIFLPLTLITGIYGMNFRGMPELRWSLGYVFALGLMVVIGLGSALYFRRHGWFRRS